MSNNKSFFLLFGEDELARNRKTTELIHQLCPPEEQTLGLETIDGEAHEISEAALLLDQCIAALRTVGFLNSGKTVWLRNANFFSAQRGAEASDPDDLEDDETPAGANQLKRASDRLLELLAKGLPPGHALVITAPKINKTLSFYKKARKIAEIHEFPIADRPRDQSRQAVECAGKLFDEAHIKYDRRTLALFAERTGMHTLQMAQDVEKISLYLGSGGKLTPEVIELLVPTTQETMVWGLGEALGHRRIDQTLNILRKLLAQKQKPIGLFIILEYHLTKLLIMSRCLERGWARIEQAYRNEQLAWSLPERAAALLDTFGKDDPRKGHPYAQLLVARQASLFGGSKALLRARERLLQAHLAAVSGSLPDDLALELGLIEIIGRKNRTCSS